MEQLDDGSSSEVNLGTKVVMVGDQSGLGSGKAVELDLGKSCWDGIEMENVWGKRPFPTFKVLVGYVPMTYEFPRLSIVTS
jgi:hypothetical protein